MQIASKTANAKTITVNYIIHETRGDLVNDMLNILYKGIGRPEAVSVAIDSSNRCLVVKGKSNLEIACSP